MTNRTALVFLAPNVHQALHELRLRHLEHLERKMPAHVTALFPFRDDVDAVTVATIEGLCARIAPIAATFREVRRFGDRVVWLLPEPDAEFRAAVGAVLDAFPDLQPYSGEHGDVTPHLSVGSRLTRAVADPLAAELVELLPLSDRIDALSLMRETGEGWRHERSWPLTGEGSPRR